VCFCCRQDVRLTNVISETQEKPDLSLDGRSVVGIEFDFANGDVQTYSLSEVESALNELMAAYENGGDTFDSVPEKFENLVRHFRHTDFYVLQFMKPLSNQEVKRVYLILTMNKYCINTYF